MKKIILIITIIVLSSCGVTSTLTYGDVSILDTNGNLIRHYDNCLLDIKPDKVSGSTFGSYDIKSGGLSFTDTDNISHYVSGAIVIVDNISTEFKTKNNIDYE